MVRLTDRPAMTIAVDLGRKATKQTKQTNRAKTPFKMHTILYFFQEKNICLPKFKIFRPAIRKTLIFLFGLIAYEQKPPKTLIEVSSRSLQQMTFVVIGALRLKTSVLQKKLKYSSILFGEHKENSG